MDIGKNNKKSGMTLVEILIVVSLLGVLMGVLVKSLNKSADTGKMGAAKIFCTSAAGNAIKSFEALTGKVPTSWPQLQKYIEMESSAGPKDPWGNAYGIKRLRDGVAIWSTCGGTGLVTKDNYDAAVEELETAASGRDGIVGAAYRGTPLSAAEPGSASA